MRRKSESIPRRIRKAGYREAKRESIPRRIRKVGYREAKKRIYTPQDKKGGV